MKYTLTLTEYMGDEAYEAKDQLIGVFTNIQDIFDRKYNLIAVGSKECHSKIKVIRGTVARYISDCYDGSDSWGTSEYYTVREII